MDTDDRPLALVDLVYQCGSVFICGCFFSRPRGLEARQREAIKDGRGVLNRQGGKDAKVIQIGFGNRAAENVARFGLG